MLAHATATLHASSSTHANSTAQSVEMTIRDPTTPFSHAARSEPAARDASQIQPPQATHAPGLAPVAHQHRRDFVVEAHGAERARVQPRRKILDDDGVIEQQLFAP